MERRGRKLRARPILNLEISDEDVEAVCCRQMLDSVIGGTIGVFATYNGTEFLIENEEEVKVVCEECPFCGKKPKKVSKYKIY